jgi:hypothetical protein
MEDGVSKCARILAIWGIVSSAFSIPLIQKVYGLEESTGPGGSNSIAVHQLGDTGQGVNVGLILGGNVRTTHEAFKDDNNNTRAFNYDFSGSGIGIIAHDTQLAGIIASRGGAAYPNDIGVAPDANLYCARVSDNNNSVSLTWIDNALNQFINTQNCRIIVTGFEFPTSSITPNGDSTWTMLYDYYAYQNDDVVFINAAGNQNTVVTVFGDAYNGITTGGLRLNDPCNQYEYRMVGSTSGSGPTVDGRRKPEITAPSQNQWVPTSSSDNAWTTTYSPTGGETSWAVPHSAGTAALLLALADTTPGPNDNKSAVIKAVMINSAMPNIKAKTGAETNPADPNNTWQADRGYGRIDALRAYQLLDTNEVEPGTIITNDRGWGYGQLARNRSNIYTIHISQRCRLIATSTWHRKITGSYSTGYSSTLPNFDMIVSLLNNSNPIFNRTLFSYDTSDNLLKCDLPILTAGDYTVKIVNNSTGFDTTAYGFAFEIHPIMSGDLPPVDYIVDYGDLTTFAANWLVEGTAIDTYLSPNGVIDFNDFAILAQEWLQIDSRYYNY